MMLNDTSREEQLYYILIMRGSRKFCQRGPTLRTFFEGRNDPNTTISETPFLAFRWRVDDGLTLDAGLKAKSLSRNRHGA